jgi:hypothetical protein
MEVLYEVVFWRFSHDELYCRIFVFGVDYVGTFTVVDLLRESCSAFASAEFIVADVLAGHG